MTRSELSDMIALADRLLGAGETAVLATLFCSDGSTYRPLGSMMVSGPGSVAAGGVSGGCVEEYVARHGRTLVQQRGLAMLSFDADPDADGGKPSLGCGGSIEVLVERMTSGHVTFLRRFRDAMDADTFTTAACVIDFAADGQPVLVRRTWPADGAEVDPLRLRAIESERSRHGVLAAGRRALVHYIPALTRLVILGAGDDVRPLCTLARSLGWHVTVADRRARLATPARFPDADIVIAADWPGAVGQIAFTPRTAVVMMTHSLSDDVDALPLLADKPLAYVGALGPPHRREWVLERASVPAALAARFRGPIGLNLGDRSPAGIAVSVTGEILAMLNARDAAPLSSAMPWETARAVT
jgi:xanthine/CO dehydrogenase XdhC/CoxF family maturation factor